MGQSFVAGIIFIIFALILGGKPGLIWQATEKWKNIVDLMLAGIVLAVYAVLGLVNICRPSKEHDEGGL